MDSVCFREAKQTVPPTARPRPARRPSAEPRVGAHRSGVRSTLPCPALSAPGAVGSPRKPGCGPPRSGRAPPPARSQDPQLGKWQVPTGEGTCSRHRDLTFPAGRGWAQPFVSRDLGSRAAGREPGFSSDPQRASASPLAQQVSSGWKMPRPTVPGASQGGFTEEGAPDHPRTTPLGQSKRTVRVVGQRGAPWPLRLPTRLDTGARSPPETSSPSRGTIPPVCSCSTIPADRTGEPWAGRDRGAARLPPSSLCPPQGG